MKAPLAVDSKKRFWAVPFRTTKVGQGRLAFKNLKFRYTDPKTKKTVVDDRWSKLSVARDINIFTPITTDKTEVVLAPRHDFDLLVSGGSGSFEFNVFRVGGEAGSETEVGGAFGAFASDGEFLPLNAIATVTPEGRVQAGEVAGDVLVQVRDTKNPENQATVLILRPLILFRGFPCNPIW